MQASSGIKQIITLTDELGKGGEATVYNVAREPDMVAKLYHQPTPERAAKLRAMLLNPPEQPRTHTAFAWPTALLYRRQEDGHLYAVTTVDPALIKEQVVGFLMPKISEQQAVFHIYNPAMRRQLPYSVDLKFRYRTATNLAVVVSALHAKGYVIGDINESNILVNRQALVTLVDCDSFQVTDESGYIHRCNVGKPEFTPPELQGVSFKTVDQLPEHDLFGLGVLLFQLLMGGYHPFAGVLQSQASVGRVDLYAIREGLFPYGDEPSISPPPAAPQFGWLHPEVQALFLACFRLGHETPAARPSGLDWQPVLLKGENALQSCKKAGHVYSLYAPNCPYCVQLEQIKQRQLTQIGNSSAASFDIPTLLKCAKQAYEQDNAEQVIAILTPLIDKGIAPVEAYEYRAWSYYKTDAYNQALTDGWHAATSMKSTSANLRFVMGLSYIGMKDYQMAERFFNRAIEFLYQPEQEVLYHRVKIYEQLKKPPELIKKQWQKVLKLGKANHWGREAQSRLEQLRISEEQTSRPIKMSLKPLNLQTDSLNNTELSVKIASERLVISYHWFHLYKFDELIQNLGGILVLLVCYLSLWSVLLEAASPELGRITFLFKFLATVWSGIGFIGLYSVIALLINQTIITMTPHQTLEVKAWPLPTLSYHFFYLTSKSYYSSNSYYMPKHKLTISHRDGYSTICLNHNYDIAQILTDYHKQTAPAPKTPRPLILHLLIPKSWQIVQSVFYRENVWVVVGLIMALLLFTVLGLLL